ncbi:unnamed protein product [Pleuronectes platessa]|uniref:Uncharacterized protein n=1 Tax=Pleuronectes platessa TaxID=8262 RepID=A0A9N7W2U2_PLEPL|nr:unnamed protein product [Pleuronectes platessa]
MATDWVYWAALMCEWCSVGGRHPVLLNSSVHFTKPRCGAVPAAESKANYRKKYKDEKNKFKPSPGKRLPGKPAIFLLISGSVLVDSSSSTVVLQVHVAGQSPGGTRRQTGERDGNLLEEVKSGSAQPPGRGEHRCCSSPGEFPVHITERRHQKTLSLRRGR